MKLLVLTISDRASAGVYEDLSGPAAVRILAAGLPGAEITRRVVPDDADAIRRALDEFSHADCIVTTGGTGLSPRDITPEVTAAWCERLVPGIAEYLRAQSCLQTLSATLSRGVAGIRGCTLVVNLPGSVRAVEFCAPLLPPVIGHAVRMLAGEGH